MAARGQPAPLAFTMLLAAVTVVGGLAVAKAPVLRQCLSAPLELSACLRATPSPADVAAPGAGGWIDARANEPADAAPPSVDLLPAPALSVTAAFVPAVVAETPLNASRSAFVVASAPSLNVLSQSVDLTPTSLATAAASAASAAPLEVALAPTPPLPVVSTEPTTAAPAVELSGPVADSTLATFGAVPPVQKASPQTDIAAPPQTLLADASSSVPPAQPSVSSPSLTLLPALQGEGSPNLTLIGKPSARAGSGSIVLLQLR